ncbi:transcriptional regulator [Thiocystis minor]|uniref:CopG family ribbon-helix-helix protein n=1 Tax=Thiocystis minor TaxID=61597 RepID=UPI001912342F|nr:transcriptional regulator [Thiocystis minor]MBK5964004.1 transcriptional regulator [Thiocystis minor]
MGVTSVRLRPDLELPLEELATRLDRSKNYIINQAVNDFIARQSQADEQWRETLEAIDSIKAGQRIDERDVTRWLETWGTEHELAPPAT